MLNNNNNNNNCPPIKLLDNTKNASYKRFYKG